MISPEKIAEMPKLDANEIWEMLFDITKDAVPEDMTDAVLAELASRIDAVFLTPSRSELLTLRAERDEAGDSRNDDIAAASILYQCADCLRAGAEYSCFNATDVFIIRKEVICRDCADSGHAGEQRRAVPDIAVKIKRQRMHATAQQRRAEAAEAQLARQGEALKGMLDLYLSVPPNTFADEDFAQQVVDAARSTLSTEDSHE